MAKGQKDYDLIVIGSGPSGGVAATYAASLGKEVLLIEKEAWGGECPNFGCVPTKALLQAAEVFETVKNAGQFGIKVKDFSFDYREIKAWKDTAVARTGASEGEDAYRSAGVKVVKGDAGFVSAHEVKVGSKTYSAHKFIIATGTSNLVPPIKGLAETGFISFREAIDFTAPPKSMFIIGGGPIGCEFAHVFSTFGTEVTIADTLPRLLGREDPEAGDLLGAVFAEKGIGVITDCMVYEVSKSGNKKVVHYEKNGKKYSTKVDEILVATGKKPNTQIGLEIAGVRYDRRGIKTNRYLQTSQKNIYASGDVVGPYMFTHTGSYQGHLAAHNAFHRKRVEADYSCVPRCTYVTPEVASVGPTEQEAVARGVKVRVGTAPVAIVGRANTSNEGIGFAKVLVDENDHIIGGTIVGPRAGELIHELAVAINKRATYQDVANTIHAFPTYSEVVKFACMSVS